MVITLLGAVTLLPHISVTAGEPLRESDPFSALFILSNGGYFPIGDVQFSCLLIDVKLHNAIAFEDALTQPVSRHIDSMSPSEQATTYCPIPMHDRQVESADIAIEVVFTPYMLWPIRKRYRFEAVADDRNHFRWVPQPLRSN